MKPPFLIFRKKQSIICLRMVDDWLIDIKERKKGKIIWDAMIIRPDLDKFISRRKDEGYSYIQRTK